MGQFYRRRLFEKPRIKTVPYAKTADSLRRPSAVEKTGLIHKHKYLSRRLRLNQAGIEVLKKGRTTLIIAHRLSTVKNADIINVIDDGKLLESGTHEELIALNSKYAEWYRLQK